MSFEYILKESVRFFVFQSKDMSLIPELQAGYVSSLLIDKLHMNPTNIKIQSCYPYKTYFKKLNEEIHDYSESCYVFFLENFYHSSTYALNEVLSLIQKLKHKKIYIHSFKISELEAKKIMGLFPHVQMIIRTDIEYALHAELILHTPLDKIGNIFYRKNGAICYSFNEDVTYDLNTYIIPAYTNGKVLNDKDNVNEICNYLDADDENTDPLILYKQPKAMQISNLYYQSLNKTAMVCSGRGCIYKCTYCYRGVKYSSIRQISLSTIKEDLDYLKTRGFKKIYFYDDCFITTNKNRINEIVDLLSQYDFSYYIAIRYEACDPDILELLSKLKFHYVQIGLQTIKHNSSHKRSFNHEKLIKVITKLKKMHAVISIDVILGLPNETKDDFINTINYAITLNPESIVINTLFVNPGTELSKRIDEFGIKTRKSGLNVPVICESNTFTSDDLNYCKEMLKQLKLKLTHINWTIR